MTTQHPFDPSEWMRRRQARAILTPAEWLAARLALLDQLDTLEDDAPAIVHPSRPLVTSPDPHTPWFLLFETELLQKQRFAVYYYRKDKRGEPAYKLYTLALRWRDGDLHQMSSATLGAGWRVAVMYAGLVELKAGAR